MDSTLLTPYELVRPWRRATLLAGSIAAIEFLVLIAVGVLVLTRPLDRAATTHPHVGAVSGHTRSAAVRTVRPPATTPRVVVRPRDHLKILVLNGNGRTGAAASAASTLRRLGYLIAATANAVRLNYATTLVMYRPGYRAEGLRLARDLGVKVVGPLDGMRASALKGGELTVILGA